MRIKIIIFGIFLFTFFVSCSSRTSEIYETSVVEPPERHTPIAPIHLSESELIDQTIQAFVTGDREFWIKISTAAYPFLHPSFETEEDFADEMSGYPDYFDLSCESVIRYSAVGSPDWSGFEETIVVFSGIPIASEDVFYHSAVTNAISIIEVIYISRGVDNEKYYLGDVAYHVFDGETVQENYTAFLEMRRTTLSKYDEELKIDDCP